MVDKSERKTAFDKLIFKYFDVSIFMNFLVAFIHITKGLKWVQVNGNVFAHIGSHDEEKKWLKKIITLPIK